MYTGNLINDLMATVEKTERGIQLKRYLDEVMLHQLFELPVSQTNQEAFFAGAA